MPAVKLDFVSLTDDDDTFLHVEHFDVPDALHASIEPFLKHLQTADRHDPVISHGLDRQTEGLIQNMLSHGAKRCDHENGDKAISIYHFDSESEALAFRMGAIVDEKKMPRKVVEKSFENGVFQHTAGFNRSGLPEFVKFKGDVRSHFLGNFATPEQAFAEMGAILTAGPKATPVYKMQSENALVAV